MHREAVDSSTTITLIPIRGYGHATPSGQPESSNVACLQCTSYDRSRPITSPSAASYRVRSLRKENLSLTNSMRQSPVVFAPRGKQRTTSNHIGYGALKPFLSARSSTTERHHQTDYAKELGLSPHGSRTLKRRLFLPYRDNTVQRK